MRQKHDILHTFSSLIIELKEDRRYMRTKLCKNQEITMSGNLSNYAGCDADKVAVPSGACDVVCHTLWEYVMYMK